MNRNVPAIVRQRQGNGPPDALRTAGNQRNAR
jgi:hypothetical protein